MDFFAHALWAYAAFRKQTLTKWAVVMSVMPDVLSFGIYMLTLFVTGNFAFGKPPEVIPDYVTFMYNITHSMFIAGMFGIFLYIRYRKYMLLVLGWVLHIGIDIFSHSEDFFPTHFLYPISNFNVSFIAWGNKWFMIANYTALLIVYGMLGIRRLRKRKH